MAQITPSQSLQQQLREDRQREALDRLEERNEQQPELEPSSFDDVTVPDGLRLEGLRIEGVLPENAAGLEDLLRSWVGLEVDQQALREIRAEILNAAPEAVEIGDRAVAISTAVSDIGDGDVVIIAGKGHETGQVVGDETLPFDDLLIARRAIDTIEGRS